jgi:SAM-dependent methyltransferase
MSETDSRAAPPSSSTQMMQLIWPGALVVQAVHVAAKLGIPDLVAKGPQTSEELAQTAKAHGPSLRRILRALASLGVFAETADGRFEHTALSETLRSDHPQSVRPWALLLGAPLVWKPWEELYESVSSGTGAFRRIYGQPFFEYLTSHPEDAAIFHGAMTAGSGSRLPAVLAAYDFSTFERLVDVGGGHGALLRGILSASPKTRAVLYDLPEVVASAESLRAADVAARCEIVGGDFFESVPAGGDGYILSRVIHDWNDERALKILQNCRRAIRPDGRLLLIEGIVTPPNEPDSNKFLDVWFIGGGGQERNEAEFRALLAQAGFELKRVIATASSTAIIESRPI